MAKQRNLLFSEERVAPATDDEGNEKVQSFGAYQINEKSWTRAENQVKTIHDSLPPHSVSGHLALSALYPESKMGQQALAEGARLVGARGKPGHSAALALAFCPDAPMPLADEDVAWIFAAADRFPNRWLKGYHAESEEEVLALSPEEIDVGQALALAEGHDRSYTAKIDLIALHIAASLPANPTPEETIVAINRTLFEEMHFRYPPQSESIAHIDDYSNLPSVLDSHRGVCLGTSLLYLALGQRLGLDLEIITPPGHIFVRHGETNIETTCRGVHLYDNAYLNPNLKALQTRTTKEAIGLVHINQASVFSQQKKWDEAISCYHKAQKYLPDDDHTKELLAIHLILAGRNAEGKALLKPMLNKQQPHLVCADPLIADILHDSCDAQGLELLFSREEETRDVTRQQIETLSTYLATHPSFQSGHLLLASLYASLHRPAETFQTLETSHSLNPHNPLVCMQLASLALNRQNLPKAWRYFS
ncbi:MAG: hypothetical protein KDK65_07175, partial [Chlamydiia bacterium]|nr:hypothetical protein [Chlamydiia bacterium]